MRRVLGILAVFNKRSRVTSLSERLKDTPVEDLEVEVARSLREESFDEVRLAMIELLKVAPLAHLPMLRIVFMKHFAQLDASRHGDEEESRDRGSRGAGR